MLRVVRCDTALIFLAPDYAAAHNVAVRVRTRTTTSPPVLSNIRVLRPDAAP
jgi:hypothetical protein